MCFNSGRRKDFLPPWAYTRVSALLLQNFSSQHTKPWDPSLVLISRGKVATSSVVPSGGHLFCCIPSLFPLWHKVTDFSGYFTGLTLAITSGYPVLLCECECMRVCVRGYGCACVGVCVGRETESESGLTYGHQRITHRSWFYHMNFEDQTQIRHVWQQASH